MKKFLQICSLLSLVLAVAVMTARAQAQVGSEVSIPFSFNIKDRSYHAGRYTIKLVQLQTGTAMLSITDPRTERTQVVMTQRSGDPANENLSLVFDMVGGERALSRVVSPRGGFALSVKRPQRDGAVSAAIPDRGFIGASDLF